MLRRPDMSPPRLRITVDLDALAANYALLAGVARSSEVAPVVKADGYGLGAEPIARRLWTEGARTFFVARLEEGEALRAVLPEATIYVLDGCPVGAAARLLAAGLTPVLNDAAQIGEYAAAARDTALPAAIHVDTGMNRLGLEPGELEALTVSPDRLNRLDVGLLVSHLACAEDEDQAMNARQFGRFKAARGLFPYAKASLANSAGVFLGPDFHLDLVRPGIVLYGGGPFGRPDRRVEPVVTVEAPILQVRAITEGDSVGYGAAWTADAPRRIAIVAAGYADGLLRASSPGGGVWFDGALRPLLGRVSMDLIAVDVTGCEAARPGALVEVLGPNRPIDDVAAAAGTIAYEVLTRIGARAERRYR
jgi:alanine racemase